jgi:flagellar basal-body rod protein FlgB
MDHLVNPITTALVQQALDQAMVRHGVHAHNIANAHTPGYQAKTVSFQAALDLAAAAPAGSSAGGSAAGSTITGAPVPVLQDTGAAVNLAQEAAALAENTLHYQTLVRMLNRHLSLATIALNDGRR